MIDILIIFALACGVLLLSFYIANKLSKKPVRVTIKIVGILLGFIVYVVLTAILNTELEISTQVGSFYLFTVLALLFMQRNKFKGE